MKQLVIAALLAGFACGDTPEGGLCTDFIGAICAKFGECNIQPEDECLQESANDCASNNGCPAGVEFDADSAVPCIDETEAATCAELVAGIESCAAVLSRLTLEHEVLLGLADVRRRADEDHLVADLDVGVAAREPRTSCRG